MSAITVSLQKRLSAPLRLSGKPGGDTAVIAPAGSNVLVYPCLVDGWQQVEWMDGGYWAKLSPGGGAA